MGSYAVGLSEIGLWRLFIKRKQLSNQESSVALVGGAIVETVKAPSLRTVELALPGH
jgi:hypothetical protein